MLTAPFPYYGGKRRYVETVWTRFGHPKRYIEPFCGSMAILLGSPHITSFEIVSDINGYICNFWRSIIHDPEKTAYYAQYPTIHDDLTSRQSVLYDWRTKHRERLIEDNDFYDAKIAGWWVWGTSNWIGPLYAEPRNTSNKFDDSRPYVSIRGSGQGSHVERESFYAKKPHVHVSGHGQGTQIQRKEFSTKRPLTHHIGVGVQLQHSDPKSGRPHAKSSGGGQGVQLQSTKRDPIDIPSWQSRDIYDWFDVLSRRLAKVVVFNREWTSFISPTVLGNTTKVESDTALFLDPPYRQDNDRSRLYKSDDDGQSHDVAIESYNWSVENGDDYKIAYCCHQDDFEIPPGWTSEIMSFGGVRKQDRRSKQDMIMFSPRCTQPEQDSLFD